MKTIQSYTWPALLALVSGVTAFSDIMRDTFVAEMLAYSLLALGIAAVVFFKAPWISGVARRAMPRMAQDFSPAAFAVSCAILGVAVYGFSQLSSRLSDQGGVIAAAYPEIESLQAQLGVVDAKVEQVALVVEETAAAVDVISDRTEFLKDAAGHWLVTERLEISMDGEKAQVMLTMNNPSAFVFDNVDIIARDRQNPSIVYVHETGLIAQGETKYWAIQAPTRPDEVELCVSGRRKSDGLWAFESRIYGNPDNSHYDNYYSYRVVETEGLVPGSDNLRCV